MKLSDLGRSAMVDAIVDLIDAGSGPGTIEFRTGAAPTNTTDADSGTLLATCTFGDPAFGGASAGVATANAIIGDASVDTDGTPGHFRVKDSNGIVRWQGSVGTSGADANFNSVTWVEGGTVSISSMTFTQPPGT